MHGGEKQVFYWKCFVFFLYYSKLFITWFQLLFYQICKCFCDQIIKCIL